MREEATCKACREGKLFRKEVTQEFERAGMEVKIDGIPALVCDNCAQVYFAPGTGDKIAAAADHLFELSAIKHAGRYHAAV